MKFIIKKNNFKFIPKFITIASGILILQMAGIYETKYCLTEKPFMEGRGTYCRLIKRYNITFPSKYFFKNYENLKRILQKGSTSGAVVNELNTVKKRFNSLDSGFTFYYPKFSRRNAGYIILSRANPKKDGEPSLELWDLDKQIMIFEWKLDIKKIIKELNYNLPPNGFVLSHPLLLEDKSLIVLANIANKGKLLKISPESKLIKFNEEYIFHHSIEMDNQGNIYVPIEMKNKYSTISPDDGFAILDKDLNIIDTYSLTEIIKKAGLDYLIFSTEIKDPYHLNDVTPFNSQTNEETNIVMLSIRSLSSIIAYNFKKDKVIWKLSGYGNRQHDVDILNNKGTHISIFDNNVLNGSKSNLNFFTTIKNLPDLSQKNEIPLVIYNSKSNHDKELQLNLKRENFNFLKKSLRPQTNTAGQAEYIIDNNSVFVEESNYGRSFEYDNKNKKLLWQFINRNDKNNIYFMKFWSRRMKDLPFNVKILDNTYVK